MDQRSGGRLPSLKPRELSDAGALAEAELKLTETVLTYARHLQAGRFPYTRVSRNIELPQVPPEPADILNRVAEASDAGQQGMGERGHEA